VCSALLGVVFCLDFDPFFFLLFVPMPGDIGVFIYLFNYSLFLII
jgi:hypothetical protein